MNSCTEIIDSAILDSILWNFSLREYWLLEVGMEQELAL
jgi:hypothetical protein